MEQLGAIFSAILIKPIITMLLGIYQLLVFLHIPYPLGFSIILLTVLIRFVLYPLITAQINIQKKTQALSPHLSKIKEKHKGDTKKQQEETMRLYKEHGLNPAAGCLPTLIQLPIIMGLYSVLIEVVKYHGDKIVTEVNKLVYIDAFKLKTAWETNFFGVPLGKSPSDLLVGAGIVVFLVPILTAVFQLIQSKMMFSKPKEEKQEGKEEKEKKKEEDFATAFQTQSLYLFPAMIGFFSYTLPFGLSLYWNTFTIFGILQQYREGGLGGLRDWIKRR